MAPLSLLLWIKIIGTLVPIGLPLLTLSKSKIDKLSGFEPSDVIVYRLYGMAILALLVGYFAGFLQVLSGVYPTGVIAMGIVSNAGACLVLILSGRARSAPHEALFFGLIATGLTSTTIVDDWAVTPLW